MSISKLGICSLIILFFGCTAKGNKESGTSLKSDGYNIVCDDLPLNEKWGKYLYDHLSRRCDEKGVFQYNARNSEFKAIRVNVDMALKTDYCIEPTEEYVLLSAKDSRTMIWLIYQFMSKLSETDERIDTNDLPPAVIKCEKTCRSFDFDYREPYFSINLKDEYAPITGTNSLETDWGIWGHNLAVALNIQDNDTEIFAKQGEWVHREQFCFSSEITYGRLREYILDNFGNSGKYIQRFMIMPNDNGVVCECDQCKVAGNTSDNATPALSNLIMRLAREFPGHLFFTSAYMTTQEAPSEKWLANTGVMVSTINMPKGVAPASGNKEAKRILDMFGEWKKTTSNVYVWDYAANFDDYLTPIPVLYALKRQLIFLKEQGIQGIFLNASGYDYSSFDDMKAYVAANLMMDVNLSVDSLCYSYYEHFYPVAGKFLADYYLSLERTYEKKNIPYDMYAGFREIAETYLDINSFMQFYQELPGIITKTKGEEKEKLQCLYTALSYTRLQLAYIRGGGEYGYAEKEMDKLIFKPEIDAILNALSQYKRYPSLINYKESDGSLSSYCDSWRQLLREKEFTNLLMKEKLKLLSKADKDYPDVNMLNDGVRGFAIDYHQGWHLTSGDDLHIQFESRNMKKARKLIMRFLVNERHHLYLPQKIEVYKDGRKYKEYIPHSKDAEENTYRINTVEVDVDFSDASVVALQMFRKDAKKSSIACDEIQIIN